MSAVRDAQGRFVTDRLGGHRTDECDVVGNGGDVRDQFRKQHARLARRAKLEWRAEQIARSGRRECLDFDAARIRLTVHPGEFGLGIEQIHLAWAAVLKQHYDAFGPWGMMCDLDLTALRGLKPVEGNRS